VCFDKLSRTALKHTIHIKNTTKNSIKVTIPFSFKGVEHTPSSVIDLDTFILGEQTLYNAYQIVANENKIDNFSYEYEVLQSSTMLFSDANGLAVDFLKDNQFDLDGFKNQAVQGDVENMLQNIASSVLNIDHLESSPEIKQALMQAYQAGLTK
jgi:hypothetical protein